MRSPQASSGGKKRGGGGFQKACNLSPALSALIGVETSARSQVVKSVWDYIKKHGLQVCVCVCVYASLCVCISVCVCVYV